MIKKLLIILSYILPVCAMAQTGPKLSFPNGASIDVGILKENTSVTDSLLLANTGDQPLQIYSAFSDCSCTVASYPRQPIEPGDSAYIKVTFKTEKRKPGGFMKIVRIRSNDIEKQKIIYVKGELKRPASRNKPVIDDD